MTKSNWKSALSLAALGSAMLFSSPVLAASWKPATPALPLEKVINDWDVNNVIMSPDGKHIAAITKDVNGGNPVIKVWNTDDLSKDPKVIGTKTMRFRNMSFIKNNRLLIIANQPLIFGATKNWTNKAIITDLEGKIFIEPLKASGTTSETDEALGKFLRIAMFNRLPKDPDNVLMTYSGADSTDIYKVNVNTGKGVRVVRGTDEEDFPTVVDGDGNVRIKTTIKAENGTFVTRVFVRDAGGSWDEHPYFRSDIAKREFATPLRFSADGREIFFLDPRGTNFATIRKYNIDSRTMSEPVFANTEYDALNVITWAPTASDEDDEKETSDNVAGFTFNGPSAEQVFNDPILKGMQATLDRAFPGKGVTLGSIKKSGNLALVTVTAPDFPTSWYIFKDKKQLIKVGSQLEGFDRKNLGPGQWVVYKARDGLDIPAILTLPPGYDAKRDGTIPTVVLPHGGPWARDDMDFDSSLWTQMFATRGFAVLQPNYRGSDGLGDRLWKAGDKEWGAKMQDDKDDGAKFLVAQGIADPSKMMMFGWSYGGFAATAAAARSGSASAGLYQCAIAGAPVTDIDRLQGEWGESKVQRKLQGDTVKGWNPYDHLKDVKIPFLLIHGDYDRQADTLYSRIAADRMRSLGMKNWKYVEIKGMSHQLVQMTPDHKKQWVPELWNWVNNNCGNISTVKYAMN